MTLISRICAAALFVVAFAQAEAGIEARQKCATGAHVIGIRGDSTDPPYPYGGLQPMVNGIVSAIPGSNNASVRYPKSKGSMGTPKGEKRLRKQIQTYVAQCPDTPIILAGYSQGAIIIMNTICGSDIDQGPNAEPLSPKYLQQIVAVNIYGDETRAADQPYNRGTCQTFGLLARKNAKQCLPYKKVIRSWCDSTDPICCVGGTSFKSHKSYGPEYDDVAIKFAVRQYHKHVRQE